MPYASLEYRREYLRKYKLRNREAIAERRRFLYRERHPLLDRKKPIEWKKKKKFEKNKRYREKYSELLKKKKSSYYQINKKEISKKVNAKLKENISMRLAHNLRTRINLAIKRGGKTGSAVKDLGCQIYYFKHYIEKMFLHGMTWDNWGDWHLDHIFPLSKANLTDREEFLEVCHYTNYQPLWASVNLIKHNKIAI